MRGGYKEIFFENRDSIRDPEYRDVYQLFMKNQCPTYPSEHFKTAIHRYFEKQWIISSLFHHIFIMITKMMLMMRSEARKCDFYRDAINDEILKGLTKNRGG